MNYCFGCKKHYLCNQSNQILWDHGNCDVDFLDECEIHELDCENINGEIYWFEMSYYRNDDGWNYLEDNFN
jgi:hypothetical protein